MKMVMFIPKMYVSPKGKMVLSGVIGPYEIITMNKDIMFPFSDIVLYLN